MSKEITVTNRSDLDPLNRKLFSVEYDGFGYWFRPWRNSLNVWVAIKDDTENADYTSYTLEIKNKISCTCDGYKRAHKCRHADMLKEIKDKFK